MQRRFNFFIVLLSLLLLSMVAEAQSVTVTGSIKDKLDQGIIGASVVVKGTTMGAISDIDGNYTLTGDFSGEQTLSCSFMGYIEELVEINVAAGESQVLNFVLNDNTELIDELVVIGYGAEKKSLLTGTISKVEGEAITQGVVSSAAESLQGRAAGVLVQSTSGQPGSDLNINIRGVSTTGNAQPLYIVDGMPVSDIGFINPSDIESMEVLKDAAAASIYGARGGNGVIIITTFSGTEGIQITYDGYVGIQNPWRQTEVLDPYQYALVSNEATRNDGSLEVPFDMDNIPEGTDWWSEIQNANAPITNHNLSVSGGNDISTFSTSLSYFSQEGTFAPDKSDYERLTARINTLHNYGIFTFGNNLSYSMQKAFGFNPNDSYERGAMITAVMNYDPTAPIYDENGDYYHSEYRSNEYSNPVATMSLINNETITNRIVGNVYADLEIIEGLNIRTSASLDGMFLASNVFNPEFFFFSGLSNSTPNVSNYRQSSMLWQWENTISYRKTFGDHTVNALFGQSALEQKTESVTGIASDLQFNDFDHAYINNTLDRDGTRAYGDYSPYRLASLFGRLGYNYKEKYIVSGVVRRDGSSRFGSNNKFGVFPSVSGGWVLSREGFYPSNDLVNFAKLRASWGQNGNDRLGDFRYTALLSIDTYNLGTNQSAVPGMSPAALANPNLKWETIEQFNVGADLGFFSNRMRLAADYYVKTTRDILIVPDVPAQAGTAPPWVNGGNVKNSGVELELSYKNSHNDFNYNASLAYAYNKNVMTEINNANKSITGAAATYFMDNVTMAFEDEAINSFYGLETNGIFQYQTDVDNYVNSEGELIQPNAKPGDLIFIDHNNDGKIDANDRTIIGNPIPSQTIGLNLAANWKGFDVSVFAYAALGYQNFNAIHRHDVDYQNYLATVKNRWMGAGSTNEMPRVTVEDPNGNYSRANSFMVEDADMFRLKKVSLGYTIPENITSRASISKLRVYVAAENLFTLTKYSGMDPEIGSSGNQFMDRGIDNGVYPMSRSFLVGLNLAF